MLVEIGALKLLVVCIGTIVAEVADDRDIDGRVTTSPRDRVGDVEIPLINNGNPRWVVPFDEREGDEEREGESARFIRDNAPTSEDVVAPIARDGETCEEADLYS